MEYYTKGKEYIEKLIKNGLTYEEAKDKFIGEYFILDKELDILDKYFQGL